MFLGTCGFSVTFASELTYCNGLVTWNPNDQVKSKITFFFSFSELRVAFAMFDKDGDGSVTSKELLMVMQSLGIDTNTEQVRQMIRKVDLDGKYICVGL